MIAAFDFDRTLINKDSLFGFYKAIDGNSSFFKAKRYILLLAAVAYKLKLFSNTRLKKIGVQLFLKGKSKLEIDLLSAEYAKTLTLNNIYYSDFCSLQKQGFECLVISAGYSEYLLHLFPNIKVLASGLKYVNEKVVGVEENLYGINKVLKLKKIGLDSIDVFYTDRFADKPLMDFSNSVVLVKDGKVVSKSGSFELINPKLNQQ